jgi:hypothetical protein
MGILDSLYTTKYIVFLDIEFQTIVHNPYILELGIIIFQQNIENPILIDHVNFPLLSNENLRMISTKYCTTSKKTEIEMKHIEDKFYISSSDIESIKRNKDLIEFIPDRNIKRLLRDVIKTNDISLIINPEKTQKIIDQMVYNLYKNRLKGDYRKMYDQIFNLYKNDDQVKKRLVNPYNYLQQLKKYFNEMTLVHKEGMDIIAINNDLKKYNVKIEKSILHKDIANYNDYFKKKYNTAKLYESFNYLKNDYYHKYLDLLNYDKTIINNLNKKMNIIKAHNPLSDAYFTLIIFIIMEKYLE